MKYGVIKPLILLKIQNMMDINVDLLQWSINFLIKKFLLHANIFSGRGIKYDISNKKFGEELHKEIIRTFIY